jgi:hypothetical protein
MQKTELDPKFETLAEAARVVAEAEPISEVAEELSADPLDMLQRGMMRGIKKKLRQADLNDLVNRTVAGLNKRATRRKANKQAKASRKRNRQ